MKTNNSYEADSEFGDRIRFLRVIFNLTQKEVAEKIGLHSAIAIYQYEKKLRKPDQAKIMLIAELGYTTNRWLLSGKVNYNVCDKIVSSIKDYYANRYPPFSVGAKLIDSLVGINSFLEKAAKRLDVPPRYLFSVTKHDIDPSSNFIRHFCRDFNVNLSEFGNAVTETDNEMLPHEESESIGGQTFGADQLKEIGELLAEDREARSLILDLLRARKIMNAAIAELKRNKGFPGFTPHN